MVLGTVVVEVFSVWLDCVTVVVAAAAGRDTVAQSDAIVPSGIVLACVVTVAAVVNGSRGVVGASGHESAFSSAHIKV